MAIIATTIILVTWYLAPKSGGSTDRSGLFRANDRQVVAAGSVIYAQNCASCHGVNLQGEPNWQSRDTNGYFPAPPHDETGHTWHHDDNLLFGITKFGMAKYSGNDDYLTRMPAYEDHLGDEQIIEVLSFIKAQWPAEIRQRHDEMNRINEVTSTQ